MDKRKKIYWAVIASVVLMLTIIANIATTKTLLISAAVSVVLLLVVAGWVDVMKVLDRERKL